MVTRPLLMLVLTACLAAAGCEANKPTTTLILTGPSYPPVPTESVRLVFQGSAAPTGYTEIGQVAGEFATLSSLIEAEQFATQAIRERAGASGADCIINVTRETLDAGTYSTYNDGGDWWSDDRGRRSPGTRYGSESTSVAKRVIVRGLAVRVKNP